MGSVPFDALEMDNQLGRPLLFFGAQFAESVYFQTRSKEGKSTQLA